MVVGETVIVPTCTATDDIDSNPECGYTGTFDNTQVGTYTITFVATDETGNQSTLNKTYTITETPIEEPLDPGTPTGYYNSAENQTGFTLLSSLKTIISGHTITSYTNTSDKLINIDADLNDPTKVYTIYSGTPVNGGWDGGTTWNKEHVWPQSSYDEASPMVSDMHQLRASVPSVNSLRNNNYFGTTSSTSGLYHYESFTFYPGDEHIGDVARILLYMATRYYDEGLRLTKDNSGTTVRDAKELGDIDNLLAWHIADPVDAFEIQRNNRIYSEQNNRNPYIDRPDFFESVYQYLLGLAEQQALQVAFYEKAVTDYQTLSVTYVPTYDQKQL